MLSLIHVFIVIIINQSDSAAINTVAYNYECSECCVGVGWSSKQDVVYITHSQTVCHVLLMQYCVWYMFSEHLVTI